MEYLPVHDVRIDMTLPATRVAAASRDADSFRRSSVVEQELLVDYSTLLVEYYQPRATQALEDGAPQGSHRSHDGALEARRNPSSDALTGNV